MDGLHVLVKDEQGSEVTVILTKEQFDQIKVGGRLAGQRGEEGSIVSGFKAYGPKGSSGGAGGSKGSSRKILPVWKRAMH